MPTIQSIDGAPLDPVMDGTTAEAPETEVAMPVLLEKSASSLLGAVTQCPLQDMVAVGKTLKNGFPLSGGSLKCILNMRSLLGLIVSCVIVFPS